MDMICHYLKLHSVLYWERASYSLFFRLLGGGTQATTIIVVHPYPKPPEELGKRACLPISKFGIAYNFIGYNRSITDPKKGTVSTCMYGSSVVAFSLDLKQ